MQFTLQGDVIKILDTRTGKWAEWNQFVEQQEQESKCCKTCREVVKRAFQNLGHFLHLIGNNNRPPEPDSSKKAE